MMVRLRVVARGRGESTRAPVPAWQRRQLGADVRWGPEVMVRLRKRDAVLSRRAARRLHVRERVQGGVGLAGSRRLPARLRRVCVLVITWGMNLD